MEINTSHCRTCDANPTLTNGCFQQRQSPRVPTCVVCGVIFQAFRALMLFSFLVMFLDVLSSQITSRFFTGALGHLQNLVKKILWD